MYIYIKGIAHHCCNAAAKERELSFVIFVIKSHK